MPSRIRSSVWAVSRWRCDCGCVDIPAVYRAGAIRRHPGRAAARIIAAMARRVVVVKLGSSTLVDPRGRARRTVFEATAQQLVQLAGAGVPVVLVSSGAIALGLGALGRSARPSRLHE